MSDARLRGVSLAVVIAAAATLLLSNLGATDLWAPDEPRFAAIAEEVRASEHGFSSWVLLRLNDEAYTQKPPLYYWLAALAGTASGRVTEVAARLPSALAGIATVGLTLHLGFQLFRQIPVGVWSAMILLTSFLFAHLARRAQLDVLLTLWETIALWSFSRLDRSSQSSTGALLVLHGALGCAVLTKGPVGLLPLAVIAVYLAWERRLSDFRRFAPIWGLALSVGPALLWITAATLMAPPGFFEEAVIDNLLGRFFAGTSHVRPFYYYAAQFPADFLPWTLLWPLAAVCAYRQLQNPAQSDSPASAWRFSIAWLGVFLVFFSLSAGKRGLYLLPAFPAVALLCGAALHETLRKNSPLPSGLQKTLLAVLVLLTAGGLFLAWGPVFEFAPGFSGSREFGVGLVLVALLIGCLAWYWARHRRARSLHAGLAVAGVFAIEWLLFNIALPVFDLEKSPRAIAELASANTAPNAAIGIYQRGTLVGGITYYGSRRVLEIPDLESLHHFVRHEGGAIVLHASHLASLQQAVPLQTIASLRRGRRRIVIAIADPENINTNKNGSVQGTP